jgi:L-fucose isomerase-like protein
MAENEDFEIDDGAIIIPATGGTERVMANIIESTDKPIMIWALPYNNSLPSALEVYSVYKHRVKLVYSPIGHDVLDEVGKFMGICKLLSSRLRLGIIGGISEWILASNRQDAKDLGVEVVDIELNEVLRHGNEPDQIYRALKEILAEYNLSALTIKCFDLLKHDTTACLAIARLNDEGIVAGCEGDIGAVLTMMIVSGITGKPCWMANTCRIGKTITLAHCTVPLTMTESYELTTHAESGKGTAIRGILRNDIVTLARYGRRKMFLALGKIVRNLREEGLCRTQIEVEPLCDAKEFVENALGNHLVVTYGDIRKDVIDFCKFKGIDVIS